MEKFWPVLRQAPLMAGMEEEEIRKLLACLEGEVRTFAQGEWLFRVGDRLRSLGLVLAGGVRLEKEDHWGNRFILAQVGQGEIFGEVYACRPDSALHVNVVGAEEGAVLLLDVRRILETCPTACPCHSALVRNLVAALADKAYSLTRKIEHGSKRTTREKLLSYLSEQAELAGRDTFTIPFDRQGLADYLGVERSAMSAALGKMRDDGILSFEKNRFTLL